MILFQIGPLNFDISSLIAFFVGIFFAAVLFLVINMILLLNSLRSKHYVISAKNVNVSDEEIEEIVKNSYQAFLDRNLRGPEDTVKYTMTICRDMAQDIARKFYPKSKRPLAELSVDETLELLKYISDRVNELLERPVLRLFKKTKISTILAMNDVKKKIDDSALVKATKKYKIGKVVKHVLGALNILNPVYWGRRLIVDTSLDYATKKLCQAVIGIVAEETYKIYSKKIFNEDRFIDLDVDNIISEADKSLEGVSDEDVKNYVKGTIIEKHLQDKGVDYEEKEE